MNASSDALHKPRDHHSSSKYTPEEIAEYRRAKATAVAEVQMANLRRKIEATRADGRSLGSRPVWVTLLEVAKAAEAIRMVMSWDPPAGDHDIKKKVAFCRALDRLADVLPEPP